MIPTDKNHLNLRALAAIMFVALLPLSHLAPAQTVDNTRGIDHFGGAVTATNNGISLLPTFSLGKPAVMFDMSVGNKKLSFEPQFRFSMEGKPWSFVFWWRYKLIQTSRFKMRVGAHPAIAFRTIPTISINGDTRETVVAQRYLAGEFSPNYFVTKDISIGVYYLHSHGFDAGATRSTHFITINGNFSNIKLSERLYVKFNPQVYYLRMDNRDGYYATATFALARKDFPISLQSIINQAISTHIQSKSDFVWNVSLIYAFRKEYDKRQ